MRKTTTLFVGIALGAMLSAPAMAQQTLTFTNSTPSVTVPLLGGSTVGITTNGNVVALCQLDTNNRCVGLPSTSTGTPPTVTLAASNFSTTIDGQGKYSSGTTFNLTPTVSNGDICVRRTIGSTPSGTNWTGTATAPFTATQVTLNGASATFSFTMDCYGGGGIATASTLTLQTSAVPPPTGTDQCAVQIPAPTGFTRQTNYQVWSDLRTVTGIPLGEFPNTGGGLGQMAVLRSKYVTIRFVANADPNAYLGLTKSISWQAGQGTGGGINENKTYVTLSQCPNDFRVPPAGTATADDPTFAQGCRNLKPPSAPLLNIPYTIGSTQGQSTSTTCALKYGNVYYFNVILASPFDGSPPSIEPGEHSCEAQNPNQCGMQVRAN